MRKGTSIFQIDVHFNRELTLYQKFHHISEYATAKWDANTIIFQLQLISDFSVVSKFSGQLLKDDRNQE